MRTLLSRKPVIPALLAAVFSSLLWAADAPATPIQAALSPTSWTTVALPAMALGITAHDGVLWVTGANEMLARSDDQGRTWNIVHFKKDGQLLFAIAFAGRDGWAMGSQGMELHSSDAGAHWTEMSNAPGSVIRLSAADAQHVIASGLQGFLYSSNGGKTWVATKEQVSKQTPSQTYSITGVAMPDAEHAGVLMDIPFDPATQSPAWQLFASTSDGGKSWQAIRFPASIKLDSLSADINGYKAPGVQYVKKPSRSVMFHSADGLHWSATPDKPAVRWCHDSECLLDNDSNWVQWLHGAATWWQAPKSPLMMNQWAAVPGVMCVVGDGLQCAQGQKLAATPSQPAPQPLRKGVIPSIIRVGGWVQSRNCRRCPAPKYPEPDRANRISGEVLLHVVVDKNGRMKTVTLMAAPSSSLADSAMQTVRGWVYDPTLLNGHAVEVDTQIVVHYQLTR